MTLGGESGESVFIELQSAAAHTISIHVCAMEV